MHKKVFPILIFFVLISGLGSRIHARSKYISLEQEGDTLTGSQALYNGKIWRDLYVSIKEDQFLFSNEFLPGTVTMNDKTYKINKLRYDIFNDEIITITDKGMILQLNKEMVDDFTMTYNSRVYKFLNLFAASSDDLSGYVNVIYKGRSALYVKFKKEISKVSSGKSFENFVQFEQMYIIHDNIPKRLKNKKDFKVLLADKHDEVKNYMKVNRIKVSVKSPDSFIPVLQYYDSLKP
jgi:hypothetical protein